MIFRLLLSLRRLVQIGGNVVSASVQHVVRPSKVRRVSYCHGV